MAIGDLRLIKRDMIGIWRGDKLILGQVEALMMAMAVAAAVIGGLPLPLPLPHTPDQFWKPTPLPWTPTLPPHPSANILQPDWIVSFPPMPFSTLDDLLRDRLELMLDTQRGYGWGSREAGQMKLVKVETTGIKLADDGESTVSGFNILSLYQGGR